MKKKKGSILETLIKKLLKQIQFSLIVTPDFEGIKR